MFRELDQALAISALQSMGNTLKGTISLLMNKICILNFLNEFWEFFDQGNIQVLLAYFYVIAFIIIISIMIIILSYNTYYIFMITFIYY